MRVVHDDLALARIVHPGQQQLERSGAQVRQSMVQAGLHDAGARQRQVDQRLRVARCQRGLWRELDTPAAGPHEAPHGAGARQAHAAQRWPLSSSGEAGTPARFR